MELTRHEFEQILDEKLDAKFDIKLKPLTDRVGKIESRLTFIEVNMVTKSDLKIALESQSQELKAYTDNQVEKLALQIAETVAMPLHEHIARCEKVAM